MSPYVRQLLDQSLLQPASDFIGSHGKRIRGSLLQLSYELAGGTGSIASTISQAIESLHAGSLVIDDIQDDSQLRRGQPTLHLRIGIPLAINAGNWMYFQALHSLSDAPLHANTRERLLSAMIRAARQCHEGQAIDLYARIDTTPPEHWYETTLAISTLKTGALVALAVELGCLSADAQAPLCLTLPKFGRQIGIALQMRNDLDELARIAHCSTDPYNVDTIRDDDLRNARLTWPWSWAFEVLGEARSQSLVQSVVRSRQERFEAAGYLFEQIGHHGDEVIRNQVRDTLRLLAEHVVDRGMLDILSQILEPIERPIALATAASESVEATAQTVTQ